MQVDASQGGMYNACIATLQHNMKVTLSFETPSHSVTLTLGNDATQVDIDGCPFDIPWEHINDVEWLSNVFGHLTVNDFRVLVGNLGIIYRNIQSYRILAHHDIS